MAGETPFRRSSGYHAAGGTAALTQGQNAKQSLAAQRAKEARVWEREMLCES